MFSSELFWTKWEFVPCIYIFIPHIGIKCLSSSASVSVAIVLTNHNSSSWCIYLFILTHFILYLRRLPELNLSSPAAECNNGAWWKSHDQLFIAALHMADNRSRLGILQHISMLDFLSFTAGVCVCVFLSESPLHACMPPACLISSSSLLIISNIVVNACGLSAVTKSR